MLRHCTLCAAVALCCAQPVASGTMGPLLEDTTALDAGRGGCVDEPGDINAICADIGPVPTADACAAACANRSSCSAMTWHGPTVPNWGLHCVLRLDGVWAPAACGAGCDHTASNKTSGWVPPPPPPNNAAWGPSAMGFTSRLKPFWFGANSSGLDSAATLALMARHAVAGYGWQTGHPSGGMVGTGEELGAAAAAHVQEYLSLVGNPGNTTVFVYRQVQVALRLFAQAAIAADDPSCDGFWLHDATTGATCLAGQPWGTADPFWDFRNSSAGDYWVDRVIAELTTEAPLTPGNGAVFFDEVDQGECGYRGGSCDFAKFNATALQAAKNAVYARTVAALNAAGIVPVLSLVNRLAASGANTSALAPCALPEDTLADALTGLVWARFYENWPQSFWVPGGPDLAAAMVANAILEGARGIPNVLHMGAACPAPPRTVSRPGRLGGDVEFGVASYLVVQSPGTTLSLSSGWMDENFCWRPDFDVDFGLPLGPAERTGAYTWTRNYTRANVALDVSVSSGAVDLLA